MGRRRVVVLRRAALDPDGSMRRSSVAHERTRTMTKDWHETELAQAARNAWQGSRMARLKNLILTLLGVWIGYFAAVNMFARTLNKIDVPLLGVPLGVYMVIQGAMIVFLVTLYLFTKN